MPDFQFAFLTEKEMPLLHETFLEAFSDYLMPIKLDWAQFQVKAKREGVTASFCAAAFVGSKMVGFIITGLGEWGGLPTAYNAGTGVLPEYRGYNLTQQLYKFLLPKLREAGVEQCLLEVIRENSPALRAYKSVGFGVTRSLDFFRTSKSELLLEVEAPDNITVRATAKPNWQTYKCFWDAAPAWQNTAEAIRKSPDKKIMLEAVNTIGEVVGYIAFFPNTGSVAQFAVDKPFRQRGIGTALLREATQLTAAPALMFVNIESTATSIIAYLERRHFSFVLRQYEMLLPLA